METQQCLRNDHNSKSHNFFLLKYPLLRTTIRALTLHLKGDPAQWDMRPIQSACPQLEHHSCQSHPDPRKANPKDHIGHQSKNAILHANTDYLDSFFRSINSPILLKSKQKTAFLFQRGLHSSTNPEHKMKAYSSTCTIGRLRNEYVQEGSDGNLHPNLLFFLKTPGSLNVFNTRLKFFCPGGLHKWLPEHDVH